MKRNDSNSAKKGARRGMGQAVASLVMALAITVGGVSTTALLASQPVGLTVEPAALTMESESRPQSNKRNEKKPAVKVESEAAANVETETKEAPAASAASSAPAAEEKPESTASSVSTPAVSAEDTAASMQPEEQPASSDPMASENIEQENAFPKLQEETEALAAEDPLGPREEDPAVENPAEETAEEPASEESTAGTNSTEEALAEAQIKDDNGTVLLTPEEIRAALDAGTLDESSIDEKCLTDENGFWSWLKKLLFGKKEDNSGSSSDSSSDSSASTPAPEPVYSGWRTVNGKTYYYSKKTHKPLTGIRSLDRKLYYFDANGVMQNVKFGIDVSKYQSKIDYEQAKKSGVEFVIIRIGYRGYGSGTLVLDPLFEQHFTNARNAGLKVGVYFFSQAVNENEAREEAQGCGYVLNGRKLDYPIYFDTEVSDGHGKGRADGLGVADRTKCAIAFCEEVKSLGYQPGVYASTTWFRNHLNFDQLKKYNIWNAHYGVSSSPIACQMWQGRRDCQIYGYDGEIDVNISYMG